MRVAKTKALISFAVTAKLICAFVFAYADCWFSHGAVHFLKGHCVFLGNACVFMETTNIIVSSSSKGTRRQ